MPIDLLINEVFYVAYGFHGTKGQFLYREFLRHYYRPSFGEKAKGKKCLQEKEPKLAHLPLNSQKTVDINSSSTYRTKQRKSINVYFFYFFYFSIKVHPFPYLFIIVSLKNQADIIHAIFLIYISELIICHLSMSIISYLHHFLKVCVNQFYHNLTTFLLLNIQVV